MTVQLFITCIADNLAPDVGEATVRLLEAAGETVAFPMDQTCCGQPAYNAGYRAEARDVAARFITTFERTEGPIVAPSGSCVAMVKHGFADLFATDPPMLARAEAVAGRTWELTQYLVHVLGKTDFGARNDDTVTYHASCHLLRGLHESESPQALLDAIEGLTQVPLDGADECCGFGGMFSIKLPDVSGAMLKRKLDHIEASGANTVVACDMGCLTHIQGGLKRRGSPVRCQHISETLTAGSDKHD